MDADPDKFAPPESVAIRRALISVFDKTGLVDFARALAAKGVEILSTGGTRSALAAAGVPVIDVWADMVDSREWSREEFVGMVGQFLDERVKK